ncbi:MAG TPA: hypothetical protein VKE94_09905 [Gemmataceae bacterium]|nr:hypothetical protein [Gemmataceae bacterium]
MTSGLARLLVKMGQGVGAGRQVRILAQPGTYSRLDSFGQLSIRIHVAAAHDHVKSRLPPSYRLGQVNFQAAKDST